MHEFSLIADLMKKIDLIAREQKSEKVIRVYVKLGALSHISADHFREHFVHASGGTVSEGAELEIEVSEDMNAPDAQDILLKSVELEESYD